MPISESYNRRDVISSDIASTTYGFLLNSYVNMQLSNQVLMNFLKHLHLLINIIGRVFLSAYLFNWNRTQGPQNNDDRFNDATMNYFCNARDQKYYDASIRNEELK